MENTKAINCFNGVDNKIINIYTLYCGILPHLQDLLLKCLAQFSEISEKEIRIIKKFLLFKQFVSNGSYDGAELSELVGIVLRWKHDNYKSVGLHKDDWLLIIKLLVIDKHRQDLESLFKEYCSGPAV